MGTLRLLESASPSERHNGDVYSCAFSADGGYVLSAGWDGVLRLWDVAANGVQLALSVSPKPLSSCAFSVDGTQWLCGSMEGLLTIIDGGTQQTVQNFVAHTRPISSICFGPDGQLVTAGWDRTIVMRKPGKEREGRHLTGHQDIVAGCRFTVDGSRLISWSYDGTVKLWDPPTGQVLATLKGHADRVVSLALSPDGRYALSGGRDSMVRLWDLDALTEVAAVNLGAETRGVFCLLDAESVVVADAVGRLFLMSLPDFRVQAQVQTKFRVMCGDLSSSGMLLALGAEDGLIHFVALEGFEDALLVVTPTQSVKPSATLLDRFFGTTRLTKTFTYVCPACRYKVETTTMPAEAVTCAQCRRNIRVNPRMPVLQGL